jgi:hypothetical protein
MGMINELQKMERKNHSKKIEVASLTRDMFDDSKILDKYFRFNNKHITRFHIAKIERPEPNEYSPLHTVSDYYLKKLAIRRVATDLGVAENRIDISSYPWNDDYFMYDDLIISADYADNKYREESVTIYDITAKDNYIKADPCQSTLDRKLFDSLYTLCIKALRNRKVMLFMKIEQCVSVLRMIIENTDGFSKNISGVQLNTLKKYQQYFEEYLSDEEVKKYVSETSDYEIFASEFDYTDYVDTYVSVIRQFTSINSESKECFDFVRGLIDNPKDPYQDKILEKLFEDEVVYVSYSSEFEDEECLTTLATLEE